MSRLIKLEYICSIQDKHIHLCKSFRVGKKGPSLSLKNKISSFTVTYVVDEQRKLDHKDYTTKSMTSEMLFTYELNVSLAFGQNHLFLRQDVINYGLQQWILTDDLCLYASLDGVLHLACGTDVFLYCELLEHDL